MNLLFFGFIFLMGFASTTEAQDMADNDEPGSHKTRISLRHGFEAPKICDIMFAIPIYQNEKFSTSIFAKSQELHFSSLPKNNVTDSDDFYDRQYGLKFSYLEDQSNTWHLNSSYGSISDKPFESGDVSNFSITLNRKHTIDSNRSWSLFLNYASNRSFLKGIPLPGYAYNFVNDDRTEGWALGVPFAVYWARPTEKLSTSFFAFFPSGIRATVGYMIKPPFQANLKLHYGQEAFVLANRREENIQFFYETKKVMASLKTYLGRQNFIEVEAGRSFGRAIYDGKSPINLTSDRFDLDDEWQALVSAQAAF